MPDRSGAHGRRLYDGTNLSALEDRSVPYLGRLRKNAVLQLQAEPHLKRPRGRPPYEPREWVIEQSYQAGSWTQPRRVILAVQERPDEQFLHHFWLVTNLAPRRYDPAQMLALYRQRGKAEGHMGELRDVLVPLEQINGRGWSI